MAEPRRHQAHRVYITDYWENEWVLAQGVFGDSFTLAAGPDVNEATLRYNYGKVIRAGEFTVTIAEPQDLNGWYVKIELDQVTEDAPDAEPLKWYGIVVATEDSRHGLLHVGAPVETGTQTFHCRGLEFLLQRKIVDSSFVEGPNVSASDPALEIEVKRAIGFNLGGGRSTDHHRKGNKGRIGDRDAPIFAFDLSAAEEWTAADIITYLFHYHPPANSDGADMLNWTVPHESEMAILRALKPTAHVQGKTVKEILDQVIDRRRLLGYSVTVDANERPQLQVFTFNSGPITLPSGELISSNGTPSEWLLDETVSVRQAVTHEDDATRYDLVIARGHPLGACFTIGSGRSSSLAKGWHTDLQTEYNAGAKNATTYATLNEHEKEEAHVEYRRQPKFEKVYSYFQLKPDFDGSIGGEVVCPDPSTGDESPDATQFWYPGLRFMDRLPLLSDHDYAVVDDVDTTDQTIENAQPEYLRPFAVIQIDGRYFDLSRLPAAGIRSEAMKTNGYTWSASLRMQDDAPGVVFIVQGEMPHVLAITEFSAADANDTYYEAQVDWADILVTVFCEFDQHAEVAWPEGEFTSDEDVVRRLVIDVPNARLDYLAPNTVVGLDDDGALIESDGGYVRDDTVLLKDIARSAYAWYGQTRKSLTVVQHDLVTERRIGELITQIGNGSESVAVNSVVTKLVFDLLAGTVTTTTQYGELDLQGKIV